MQKIKENKELKEKNKKKGLKAFLKGSKAQIRGVDFSLALLIFVIAFSQVIIVLSNLLIPSLVQMETYSEEQELNKLYSNIFSSKGNPTNWGTIATASLTDFRLGLMGANGDLDFTKINRLTSDLSSYWTINYLNVKVAYHMIRDFAVSIYSPISISIDDYTAAFGVINLYGEVNEYQTPIEGAEIWAFAIDNNNNVVSNYTTTKDISGSISFRATLTAPETDYYTIVVFAQVGEIYQDYVVKRLIRESSGLEYYFVDFDFRPFIKENTNSPGSAIDVTVERNVLSDEAHAIVVFPFSDLGVDHHKQNLTKETTAEGEIYSGTGISITTNGLAVVVVNERAESTYSAGYIGVPMFQNSIHGGIFAHSSFQDQQTYISKTKMFTIRNILLKCQIWYW